MFWFHHELWCDDINLSPADFDNLPFHYETPDIGFYEAVALKLLALMNTRLDFTPNEFEQRRAEATVLLQGLVMDFEHHARLAGKTNRQLRLAKYHKVRDLVVEISRNPERYRSPGDIAKKAGYNTDYLGRLFREVLKISPQEVILNARIAKAKQLLTLTHIPLNVSDIAEMCGYQSVFYFSRQFRQRTGYSPTEFKRKANMVGNVPGNWIMPR